MKIGKSFSAIFLYLLFATAGLYAQNFNIKTFTNEDGLPSNLCKWVEADDDGFIWFATDAGLVRYDGKSFISFSDDLPSQYVKALHFEKDEGLYVLTDLGLGILHRKEFTYQFSHLISGSGSLTDSTLYYPKSFYRDHQKKIWIGEPSSIVRYSSGKFKRYQLSPKYFNDSYSRAFFFYEDQRGGFYAISWSGHILKLNNAADMFEEIPLNISKPLNRIYSVFPLSENTLLLGSKDGIYQFDFDTGNTAENSLKLILRLEGVNTISKSEKNQYLIGTLASGLYAWNPEAKEDKLVRINKLDFSIYNQIFKDSDGIFWTASDEGAAMLRPTLFSTLNLGGNNFFTRSVSYSENSEIIISDPDGIFKIKFDENGKPNSQSVLSKTSYFVFTAEPDENMIWISFRDGSLDLFCDQKYENIMKASQGSRLSLLTSDHHGKLWAYQDAKELICLIDKNKKMETFGKREGVSSKINSIRIAPDGSVYLTGIGNNSYLYKFDPAERKFKNISVAYPIHGRQEFAVYDMAFNQNGTYWLGSNFGLFHFDSSGLKKIQSNVEYGTPVVKGLMNDRDGNLWLGTERGLLVYDGNEMVSFEKEDGLPNATIAPRSIIQTHDGRIVFGTARGAGYSAETSFYLKKTNTPVFLSINFNGFPFQHNDEKLISGAQLESYFSTLSYPAEKIIYQYRLMGLSDDWSFVSLQNRASFSNLPSGVFKLQIRAKQPGFLMSDSAEFQFEIFSPWYFSWWMMIVYSFVISIIIYSGSHWFQTYRIHQLEAKQFELEKIVEERTRSLQEEKFKTENALETVRNQEKNLKDYIDQLRKAYEDLTKANEVKNELLSVATHDMKNPLQSIMGYTEIIQTKLGDSPVSDRLQKIHQSAERMLKLVNNLLETTALESGRFELIFKPTNLLKLTESVISNNQPQAQQKNQIINLKIQDETELLVEADEGRLKEAIDNLVSNAIKYSQLNKEINILISRYEQKARVAVQDEGPGLTEEDKKKLFGKFQRLSAKPTAGETSTGLGLSIVKDVIELHQGKVWVESQMGSGSVFIIELPLLL